MFAKWLMTLALALASGAGAQSPTERTGDQAAWAQTCGPDDEWDKPGPPFRVVGNTYYVGTCGIAAILITGDQGHVLIDGGTAKGAAFVADNITRLGFKLRDVKIILNSHEHYDHVGGLAALQKMTGARVLTSPAGAAAFAKGAMMPGDPQYGLPGPFAPIPVAGIVVSGRPVRLGVLSLMPIATPGHTSGALSWTWRSCDRNGTAATCQDVVYADSMSPVSADGYRFSDYPLALQRYRTAIDRLAAQPCTLLLTPHPSASQMHQRLAGEEPLTDRNACRNYAASRSALLEARLKTERGPRSK